jgi:hypothetical protein
VRVHRFAGIYRILPGFPGRRGSQRRAALPKPGWFVACGTSLSTPLLAGLAG